MKTKNIFAIIVLSAITFMSFAQMDTIKKKKMTPPDIIGNDDRHLQQDSLRHHARKYKKPADSNSRDKKDTSKSPVKKPRQYRPPEKDSV